MIKAIIFDMDGVISDTNQIHAQIESELLKLFNINISEEEIIAKYSGVRTDHFFRKLLQQNNIEHDVGELINDKHHKFISKLEQEGAKSIPGVVKLIGELQKIGFKLAVASGSEKRLVKLILEQVGVIDKFDEIISAEEVTHGKPHPDIFLLAAEKLSVSPEECVVIEDSINGMQAANAAGMKCIGLTNDKQMPADIIISSFSEISIETIKNL